MDIERGVYKDILARLENYGPATTAELTALFGFTKNWMNRALHNLRVDQQIHIGGWKKDPEDKHNQRIWHFGMGKTAPRPERGYVKKGNDTVDDLIVKALHAHGEMAAVEINAVVHRSRSSINNSLRFLKDAKLVRVVGQRKQPRGFDQLVYGLPAGAFERLIGVEKGVVVPHSLSNTSCDAENV